MKFRILLLVVLTMVLFPTLGIGQTLETFWGQPFGVSADDFKKAIDSKTNKIGVKKVQGKLTTLMYEDVSFAGWSAPIVSVIFYNNQLFGATVYFIPNPEKKILTLYEGVKEDLVGKYGPTPLDVETYKSPYSKGDGYELSAIKRGYTTIGAVWYFPIGATSKVNDGSITLTVEPKIWIELTYRGGPAYKRYLEELKKAGDEDL